MKENMRKKNVLNLIKYYAEQNDEGFKNEAYTIARLFDQGGDPQLAEYIMALLSGANTFVPQSNDYSSSFFSKVSLAGESLPLPSLIMNDIIGVINSIRHHAGFNKFLFEGDPGTGKTETVKQIARILDRELYAVDFDSIIDSKLGQTSKNIASVFQEIRALPNPEKIIILLDEIDAIALDRVNSNDLREMGRVTSSVLKGLDSLGGDIVLIATTNLFGQFDKALSRRFDSIVNFNRYSKDELVDVAESILNELLTKFKFAGRNMRLFRKIVSSIDKIPYPGELKNIIKTSVAFSDPTSEYDYLRKFYEATLGVSDLKTLQDQGFSVRDIEILTGVSKSQVARELQG
jgi:ATPase family associated with various cellular activities (AAA)